MKYFNTLAFLLLLLIMGCTKDDPASSGPTSMPEITSITADKTQILYGGEDHATLTCNATGGSLKYTWKVDLGDLIPMNGDHSKVKFTGAACCVGEKTITCTVSNDKGSVSKDIVITILENETQPEIISIESEKSEIKFGTDNPAIIRCNALGGRLKYHWEADCGTFDTDSSKVRYTASEGCIGTRTIKCTVSNSKGSAVDSIKINVIK